MTDQTQFCFKCSNPVDSSAHGEACLGQVPVPEVEDLPAGDPAPDDPLVVDGGEKEPVEVGPTLEVITGFIVAVGRSGRPMVLPLDLRGVKLAADRVATNQDVQAACREISDDLLAHRAAEYSETPAQMGAVADILGELVVRIEKAEQ